MFMADTAFVHQGLLGYSVFALEHPIAPVESPMLFSIQQVDLNHGHQWDGWDWLTYFPWLAHFGSLTRGPPKML